MPTRVSSDIICTHVPVKQVHYIYVLILVYTSDLRCTITDKLTGKPSDKREEREKEERERKEFQRMGKNEFQRILLDFIFFQISRRVESTITLGPRKD